MVVQCSCGNPFEQLAVQLNCDYLCEECRYLYGDYLSLTIPAVITQIPEGTAWLN